MATSIFKADRVGNLTNLATDAKTNLVAAINEVDSHADTANSKADIVQAQVSNSGDAYSASKAYAVGELCIYNNVLYRCITACTAASWSVNSSCFTPDTLTNVINLLNDVASVTPTYSASSFLDGVITKNNKHVTVSIRVQLTGILNANSSRVIITNMPIPKAQVEIPVFLQSGSTQNFGWLDTNGDITIYSYVQIGTANIMVLSFAYDIA